MKTETHKDTSIFVAQREKIVRELSIKERNDLTDKQKEIIGAAMDKASKCILINGCPGAAKSYTSILSALKLLNSKKVSQIVYIRSLVQAKDGETGFLAGSLEEKTFYFNQPLYQALEEILPKEDIDYLIKDGRIITYPTSMLRSYNFHNSAIIVEEAQNMTFDSIYTASTRAGMYSRLFVIGDSKMQNDLGKLSGFSKFVSIFSDEEARNAGFRYFHLDSNEIVRSPFVKFVVQKIEKYNAEQETAEKVEKDKHKSHTNGNTRNGNHLVLPEASLRHEEWSPVLKN